MTDLVKRPVWCHPTYGYIGRQPRSAEGGTEWPRAAAFIRTHQQAFQLFNYSGPPDSTYNPLTGTFWVINYGAPRDDGGTSRKYAIEILTWAGCSAEVDQAIEWYDNHDDVAASDTIYARTINDAEQADTWGDRSHGIAVIKQVDVPIKLNDGNQRFFGLSKLTTANVKLAALSIWQMPDIVLDSDNQIQREHQNRKPLVIRGTDDPDVAGTLGKLMSRSNTIADETLDTVEQSTRRCLFQWGHPAGVWSDQNSYNQVIGGFVWPVMPRNLLRCDVGDTRTVVLWPAFVVTCDEGAKVKYVIGGTTYEWTASQNYTTPTLIADPEATYYGSELTSTTVDDGLRYCTISIKAPVGGEITLHTLSLWEWEPYPRVLTGPA